MSTSVTTAGRRFARAANLRACWGRVLQGIAVAAVTIAAAALLVRACGGHLPLSWNWAWALVPALAWAAVRTWRTRLSPLAGLVHLDRRLGCEGLLLSVAAADQPVDPGFAARAAAALQRQRSVLPQVRWRQVLPRLAGALALLVAVAAIGPPPSTPERAPVPALQIAIDRLAERVEQLESAAPETIDPVANAELQQRLAELQRELAAGAVPDWSELDRLQARVDRQELLQRVRADEAARAAAAAKEALRAQSGAALAEAIERGAQALARDGRLDDLLRSLPADLLSKAQAEQLAAQAQQGAFDPAALGLDAAALQQLAAKLAEAGAAGAMLDPAARRDLAALLRQRQEHQHGPECAGGT